MAVVTVLIQAGFQLLNARGQVSQEQLVVAHQLLHLILQGGDLALVRRQ